MSRFPRLSGFAAVLAVASLAARPAPADQKPVPPASGATTKSSVPSGPSVAVVQKPDLVVTFEGSGSGLPTGFTVKNIGNADSKLSVLKVTATLVPPQAPSGGGGGGGASGCPGFYTPQQCESLLSLFGSLLGGSGSGASVDNVTKACGNPFPEFLEAVPVLKPGESKTFMRDVGPQLVLISGIAAQPISPQVTHVKKCPPTLVCAWDIKAVADASNDNDERNEQNNTATKHALREVSMK